MIKIFMPVFVFSFVASIISCKNVSKKEKGMSNDSTSCCMKLPSRFQSMDTVSNLVAGDTSTKGMIFIPGGKFSMGGDNSQADQDELPKHDVEVSAFLMDESEVTNAQFQNFVEATGYVTTAEKKPDWNELKKSLPPDTPKPSDSLLVASSLVFIQSSNEVNLNDYSQWWSWVRGANWRHPQGPGSDIIGKENYPVVQVSWYDAVAYCKWAGKRLPTEAEWEWAARGGLKNQIYPWGNDRIDVGLPKANSWEGEFPFYNLKRDGYVRAAPVKKYQPNRFGLYDMAGNVWEWCADWYDAEYYKKISGSKVFDPVNTEKSFDPDEPYSIKRVLRGGSFLCNDSYCSGYRNSRRMKSSPDTGLEHTGFRCVKDVK